MRAACVRAAGYARQLLSLAAAPGAPSALRDTLLALLVDKMIEIDVRCPCSLAPPAARVRVH